MAEGVYEGVLPPDVPAGRCTLSIRLGTFDTADDADDKPEQRIPTGATLTLTPNVTGPVILPDGTIMVIKGTVLTSDTGEFDFWAIDGMRSSVNPAGWNWTAVLKIDAATQVRFTFSPDSTSTTPLNLGALIPVSDPKTGVATVVGRGVASISVDPDTRHVLFVMSDNTTYDAGSIPPGPPGDDGRTPVLTWNGTAIVVDGVEGPDLKGPEGDQGDPGPANILSIGTVTKGETAEAEITGTSPAQVLNLTLPKGDKGDPGTGGTGSTAVAGTITLPTGGAWVWNKYNRETSGGIATSATLGGVILVPLWINQFVGAKVVALTVKTAAAGALLRLGVYSAGADLMPKTLAFDAGTVDASTTGLKQATIGTGITLPTGLYWIAVATQGASGATVGGSNASAEMLRVAIGGDFADPRGMIQSDAAGVTAALPATWTAALGSANNADTFTVAVAR